jgi:hypothetical protein
MPVPTEAVAILSVNGGEYGWLLSNQCFVHIAPTAAGSGRGRLLDVLLHSGSCRSVYSFSGRLL